MLTVSFELLAWKALCGCFAFLFALLGRSAFQEGAWLSAQRQQFIQNLFARDAWSISQVKITCASLLASPRAGSWSPARSGVAGHGTGRGSWCEEQTQHPPAWDVPAASVAVSSLLS